MRARVKTKVACLTSVGWEGAIKSLIADQIAWTACYREEEEEEGGGGGGGGGGGSRKQNGDRRKKKERQG